MREGLGVHFQGADPKIKCHHTTKQSQTHIFVYKTSVQTVIGIPPPYTANDGHSQHIQHTSTCAPNDSPTIAQALYQESQRAIQRSSIP